ncbi:MAG: hypothetical protein WDZ30_12950 [Cellvibrionaceae bacterium]
MAILAALFPSSAVSSEGSAHAQPWELRAQYWEDLKLDPVVRNDRDLPKEEVPRNEYFVGYTWQYDENMVAASYAHHPVLIRRGEPGHNGYFHQLDIRYQAKYGATRLSVSAGIHGSSNMFKHGDFHGEALVGGFAATHSLDEDLGIGLNGDYRFGHFQVYPTVRWTLPISVAGVVVANLPVAVHWHGAGEHWRVGVERYGEKWAALDRERKTDSAFYLNEWRFSARWTSPAFKNSMAIELGAGISFDTEVHHLDLATGWVVDELDSAAFVLLGLKF